MIGFVLPVVGIWAGIRHRWREVINISGGFFVLFLYSKCFYCWWFDRAKLESIGFDCRRPVTPANARHYRMMPPRASIARSWSACRPSGARTPRRFSSMSPDTA